MFQRGDRVRKINGYSVGRMGVYIKPMTTIPEHCYIMWDGNTASSACSLTSLEEA